MSIVPAAKYKNYTEISHLLGGALNGGVPLCYLLNYLIASLIILATSILYSLIDYITGRLGFLW